MRLKTANLLWGLLFIVLGFGFAVQAYTPYDVFFDGWWTLFLIIAALISMVKSGIKTSNLVVLFVGGFLLLQQQDILNYHDIRKLFIPCILFLIGLSIIFETLFKKNKFRDFDKNVTSNTSSIFNSESINYSNMKFEGTTLSANFGGITLDLRTAIIEHDVTIECSCIFGGIDIYVPHNINLQVSGTPIFGGVTNKAKNPHHEGVPTIYIQATCIFGGVDIK